MKKKIIGGLLLSSFAFVLASCSFDDVEVSIGTKDTETTESEGTDSKTTTEEIDTTSEKYQIYLLASSAGYTGTYQEWLDSIRGAEVQLQVADGYLQWRYSGDSSWKNLISLEALKGAAGAAGMDGKTTELQVSDGYIQWRYVGEESWNNLLELATITGSDGASVELSINSTHIVWRYAGSETWVNLIALEELKGEKGDTGDDGLSAYELFLKKNPNYEGSEEDWLKSLNGEDGLGIAGIVIDDNGDLIITYTDGTTINAGHVKGEDATLPEAETYTVTFDSMGGSDVLAQEIKIGYTPEKPEDPTKEGYTFLGWYYSEEEEWSFDFFYHPKDFTLYAKWAKTDMTCSLDLDGGCVLDGCDTITMNYGEDYTLPQPAKDGYTFDCWEDSNGEVYYENFYCEEIDDFTLYAKYIENEVHYINLDSDGDGVEEQIKIHEGEYYNLPVGSSDDGFFHSWLNSATNEYVPSTGTYDFGCDLTLVPRILEIDNAIQIDAMDDIFTMDWRRIEGQTITIGYPTGLYDVYNGVAHSFFNSPGMESFSYELVEINPVEINGTIDDEFDTVPDIYPFSSEYFQRYCAKDYLAAVPYAISDNLVTNNYSYYYESALSNDTVYAYPAYVTTPGLFVYYNKSDFEGVNMQSIEDMVAKCEELGTYFQWNLSNIWYAQGFFMNSCVNEFEIDETGRYISANNTYATNGLEGAKKLKEIMNSESFWNSTSVDKLSETDADRASFAVSGTWDYETAKAALGDNFAVTYLPCYTTSTDKTCPIGSPCNEILLGVKSQDDLQKELLLNALALMLTGSGAQASAFSVNNGYYPTQINSYSREELSGNEICAIIPEMMANTVIRDSKNMPLNYWTMSEMFMTAFQACNNTDEELQAVLTDYSTNINNIPNLYGLYLKSPVFDNALFDMDALFKDNGNGTFQITITFEEGTEEFNAGYIVLAESPYSVLATYENVAEESQQYLDLEKCQDTSVNGAKSIWLAGAGTYVLIYNDSTSEITIETLA